MAWPTLGILDSGVRANENPLSHGGDWVTDSFGVAYIISSNKIVPNTSYSGALWQGGSNFGPDMEVYIKQDVLSGSGTICAFWLRLTGSSMAGGTGYLGYITPTGAGQSSVGANVIIVKRITGTDTTIKTVTTGLSINAGDQFGFGAVGSVLDFYQNGISIANITDPDITGAGKFGIQSNASAGSFSNFGGGTLTSGVAYNLSLTGSTYVVSGTDVSFGYQGPRLALRYTV